jgi:hypothetical protein
LPTSYLLTLHDICDTVMDMTTKQRANHRTAGQFIAAREDFDANGTLTGSSDTRSVGRLPSAFMDEFARAIVHPDIYIIRSYSTPIAWYANGCWTMPATKYSVSTSKHQTIVRRAVFA